MFSTSTQRKFWTFSDESELARLREKHNLEYISRHAAQVDETEKNNYFLSPEEERQLLRQYELYLRDLCSRFSPPLPKAVVGTAFHYFKRFYLYTSSMDYHPKEILNTCVYFACKVEEFYVSITQFVANLSGDRDKASKVILNTELLLMEKLKYHLTIHNPFRPVEGFLIDIKTRCSLANPDRLRCGIDKFLDKVFLIDACLLYAPSQIALAAVLHAASEEQENLDSYVTEMLFRDAGADKLAILNEAVRKIRSMVKMVESPPKERIEIIEKKLDRCRNQENNPSSEHYKHKILLDEEDTMMVGDSHMSPNTSGVEEIPSPSPS